MINPAKFPKQETLGVYRAIYERRDVRSGFLSHAIPAETLANLLSAAHHAPSVGFMQPWDFIIIDDENVKSEVKQLFDNENQKAASKYEGEIKDQYNNLKLEAIFSAPLNLCVTCDRTRGGDNVVGRDNVVDTDIFSTCMAVQNLWLAARAEGIGMCWVSLLDPQKLSNILGLPDHVYPVAYLCLGFVDTFDRKPELQSSGWRKRLSLSELIHYNHWDINIDQMQVGTKLESFLKNELVKS